MRKQLVICIVAVLITISIVALVVSQKLLFKQLPSVPQTVSAIAGVWQTTINWTPVKDAKSYAIYWSTTPNFTKTGGTKIEVSNPPYVHQNLKNNVTYYYRVTAVSPDGESELSSEVSVTTRLPRITGTATLPELDVKYKNGLPGGGLYGVYLLDLSYKTLANETGADIPTNNSFSFSVHPNRTYILTAYYYGGQAISAVAPTVVDDVVQNISVDTEVAMDLIVATEHAQANLEPASLSRPLGELLVDANQEVAYLNAFYANRNQNRSADRTADAVHNLLMDQLNQGKGVSCSLLNYSIIRAYGGGLQGMRSLSDMLKNPNLPLNPAFTFTRYNSTGGYDFGMSDLENKRWDYLESGFEPNIAIGGDECVYVKEVVLGTSSYCGIYKASLDQTHSTTLLTPDYLSCETPCWSPDQTKIAFAACIGNETSYKTQPYNIYVMNADGSNLVRLTNYTGPLAFRNWNWSQGADSPSWSPDGEKIVFAYNVWDSTGQYYNASEIDMINSDGTNLHTFFYGDIARDPRWSPDGSRIVFENWAYKAGYNYTEICVAPSNRKPGDNYTLLTTDVYDKGSPSWSYDGRFIIFSTMKDGVTAPDGTFLKTFYVISSYTLETMVDFGNFANASNYFTPCFTATDYFLVPKSGVAADSAGNAIISSGNDKRQSDSTNPNNYYQVIDGARNFEDPEYGGYINYYIPDWP